MSPIEFVDRLDEISCIKRFIHSDTTRALGVCGKPGSGKTALMREVVKYCKESGFAWILLDFYDGKLSSFRAIIHILEDGFRKHIPCDAWNRYLEECKNLEQRFAAPASQKMYVTQASHLTLSQDYSDANWYEMETMASLLMRTVRENVQAMPERLILLVDAYECLLDADETLCRWWQSEILYRLRLAHGGFKAIILGRRLSNGNEVVEGFYKDEIYGRILLGNFELDDVREFRPGNEQWAVKAYDLLKGHPLLTSMTVNADTDLDEFAESSAFQRRQESWVILKIVRSLPVAIRPLFRGACILRQFDRHSLKCILQIDDLSESDFQKLVEYSIEVEGNLRWRIHEMPRRIYFRYLAREEREEFVNLHRQAFLYYTEDTQNASDNEERFTSLAECIYHGFAIGEDEAFLQWRNALDEIKLKGDVSRWRSLLRLASPPDKFDWMSPMQQLEVIINEVEYWQTLGEYSQAENLVTEIELKLAETHLPLLARASLLVADMHCVHGEWLEAVRIYRYVLNKLRAAISEDSELEDFYASVWYRLGQCYAQWEQVESRERCLKKALYAFNRSKELFDDESLSLPSLFYDISVAHYELEGFENAREYALQSRDCANQFRIRTIERDANFLLARICWDSDKDYRTARHYISKAREIAEDLGQLKDDSESPFREYNALENDIDEFCRNNPDILEQPIDTVDVGYTFLTDSLANILRGSDVQ